jgi:DNA processing protein
LIAALALGVVVIEATEKSGSLITARIAAELGREIFALPGSIRSPFSSGCHQLIQQGAKLVTSPKEVLEELIF